MSNLKQIYIVLSNFEIQGKREENDAAAIQDMASLLKALGWFEFNDSLFLCRVS